MCQEENVVVLDEDNQKERKKDLRLNTRPFIIYNKYIRNQRYVMK